MKTESQSSLEDKFPTLVPFVKSVPRIPIKIGRSIYGFGRRWAKPIGKVTLAIVILVLIVHSTLMVIWGRALENKLDALRAQGQPINMADLVPAPVPDPENAAVIYQQISKIIGPGEAFTTRSVPNTTKNDVPDAFFDAPAAGERSKLMPEVRATINRNASAFTLAEQAVNRPKCVFPIKWTDGYYAVLPHYSSLRRFENLTSARAIMRAENGDMDGSVHDVILGLDVADSLKEEPILISFLVRQAMIRRALTGMMESTRTHPLSYTQARLMQDRLDAIDLKSHLIKSMQGEHALVKWAFDTIRDNPLSWIELSEGTTEPRKLSLPMKAVSVAASYLWRPVSYKDQMAAIDLFKAQEGMYVQPYHNIGIMQMRYPAKSVPKYAIITRIATPFFENVMKIINQTDAAIGLGQTASALQVYKSRSGSYPASLDDLKLEVDRKIPIDPFSGKPFVYKPSRKGFILYSVGPDMKDDGGKNNGKALYDKIDKGDIVWVCER